MFISEDCGKCGSRDAFLRKRGRQVGLYCDGCGRWYKWVGKKDLEAYTRRGFKIHPESYEPPHMGLSESGGFSVESTPFDLDDTKAVIKDNLPSIESIENREKVSKMPEADMRPKTPTTLEDCPVCISGTIDPLSSTDDVSLTIFEGIMSIRTRDNRIVYGHYKINHCPNCGKKL